MSGRAVIWNCATPSNTRRVRNAGRPIINRYFGGSKAYYNLAAYVRHRIGLKEKFVYGPDYGASIAFDGAGKVLEAAA